MSNQKILFIFILCSILLFYVSSCQKVYNNNVLHYFYESYIDSTLETYPDIKDTVFTKPMGTPAKIDLVSTPSDAVQIAWIILKRIYQTKHANMNTNNKYAVVDLINDSIWDIVFLGTPEQEVIHIRKKDGKVLGFYESDHPVPPISIEEYRQSKKR
ncbi:MAG: hypothetical protein IJ698_01690 [Prevotella sp.]|nr:hypothetical protein [Prevotella sp.]